MTALMPVVVSPDDLKDARFRLHGSDRESAATTCGVSLRQYLRWESGASKVPVSSYRLLCILGQRDLADLHPEWAGFIIGHDALLYPPTSGIGWSPQDVSGLFFHHQMANGLKISLREAEEALEERPIIHGLQISLTLNSDNPLQLATMAAAIISLAPVTS